MSNTNNDIEVLRFAQLLAKLDAPLPISDAMEQADPRKNGRGRVPMSEYLSKWFASQVTLGSGAFKRQKPNMSAKKAYNMLHYPEGRVWIAEALGADTDLVQRVADKALTIPRSSSAALTKGPFRNGFVLSQLPWELIAPLAKSRLG